MISKTLYDYDSLLLRLDDGKCTADIAAEEEISNPHGLLVTRSSSLVALSSLQFVQYPHDALQFFFAIEGDADFALSLARA